MRFVVDAEIFGLFPGMRLAVAVAEGLDHRKPTPALEDFWRAAWRGAAEAVEGYGNAQSHPRVKAWREAMGAVGVPGRKFPSSIEAMLRRAAKGGEPFSVNPLVDFYNAVSLRHVLPVGGFDLGGIGNPLELRLTREGDAFRALDAAAAEPVDPGEVAYAFGDTVLTRHFVWRQSREGLITERTGSVLLVSEVLGGLEAGLAGRVLEDLRGGLAEHFGTEPATFLLGQERPSASW